MTTATPPATTAPVHPLTGVHVWIWNLANCDGGDPNTIAQRLAGCGCAGAIVKATDAGHGFNDWDALRALAGALHARGLRFSTWGYCYDYSEPAEQAAALSAIAELTPDCHVLDVEQEDENQPNTAADATALAQAIRSAHPTLPLVYAPLPAITLHVRLPYRQFTDEGLAMAPQLYYTGLGWTPQRTVGQFWQAAAAFNLLGQPVFPAYEDAPAAGAGSTDLDHAAFLACAALQGATGVSVWDYEHLDGPAWQRTAAAARAFPPAGSAGPKDLAQQLQQTTRDRDRLSATLEQVRALVSA